MQNLVKLQNKEGINLGYIDVRKGNVILKLTPTQSDNNSAGLVYQTNSDNERKHYLEYDMNNYEKLVEDVKEHWTAMGFKDPEFIASVYSYNKVYGTIH